MMKHRIITLVALAATLHIDAAIESGKTYRIEPAEVQGKSLFVGNASEADEAPVVIWTETDVPAQQWRAEVADDGTVTLRNLFTGKYLDAPKMRLVQSAAPASWTLEATNEEANEYKMKQERYLRTTNTNDGWQPVMSATSNLSWRFVEVRPQATFDTAARQRMIDGYLAQYKQERVRNYCTFMDGGWGEAEILEALLDCYEATGDAELLNVFEQCYGYLRYSVGTVWTGGAASSSYHWFGYDFNDDVMWLIIAAARAYHLTGNQRYLTDARNNFDRIWRRAYLGYVGLLRWAESSGDRNGANSCVNGPAEVAACYIAAGLNDESYYEKARELYANQRKYLYEPATGHVYDSVVFNPDDLSITSSNPWASTYNQGTMLGAATLLYRHYGEAQYKDAAARIIAFAKKELCNEHGIVSVCQNADGDFQGFKGILMRYAGLYAREFNDDDYGAWVLANGWHAYNNMNSRSFGHSAWLTKADESLLYNNVDYSLPGSAFGASTALTAACGYPLPEGDQSDIEEIYDSPIYDLRFDNSVYDLQGRKVNGQMVKESNGQMKKGIYIWKGKKVIK